MAPSIQYQIRVDRLSPNTTEQSLRRAYSAFGKVLDAKIATDRNGNSKKFGFVSFNSEKVMNDAIDSTNGPRLDGCIVTANPFRGNIDAVLSPRQQYECRVGNLSFDTSEATLLAAFKKFGAMRVKILEKREFDEINKEHYTTRRGFGFISFTTEKGMMNAIASMNGKDLDGRTITVEQSSR